MTPLASIIIATYNRPAVLDRTLRSIVRQVVPFPYEVIVVDDGSDDPQAVSVVVAQYGFPPSVSLAPTRYRNPAVARNVSVQRSMGSILILQSDDVEHDGQAITTLVSRLQEDHDTCVLATVTNVDAEGRPLDLYTGPHKRRLLFFLGAVRREHFLAVGGFDESFIEPGYEDKWFGTCLERIGVQPCFLNDVHGRHRDHPRPDNSKSPVSKKVYRDHVTHAEQVGGCWRAWSSPFVAPHAC
jgi:glycosyltransferase involved in cell wall biosynthesis